MADITWADVEALDAVFEDTPAGQQTFILALVIEELSPDVWGDKLNMGQTLLAAHYATDLDGASSATGAVLSEKVGEVSRTYSDASAGGDADDDLTTTFYGRQYLRLMKTLPLARFGISS